jgi:hypothetical protein
MPQSTIRRPAAAAGALLLCLALVRPTTCARPGPDGVSGPSRSLLSCELPLAAIHPEQRASQQQNHTHAPCLPATVPQHRSSRHSRPPRNRATLLPRVLTSPSFHSLPLLLPTASPPPPASSPPPPPASPPPPCCQRINVATSNGAAWACEGNTLTFTVRTTEDAGSANFTIQNARNGDAVSVYAPGLAGGPTCSSRSSVAWGIPATNVLFASVSRPAGAPGVCTIVACNATRSGVAAAGVALALGAKHGCVIRASDGGVLCGGKNVSSHNTPLVHAPATRARCMPEAGRATRMQPLSRSLSSCPGGSPLLQPGAPWVELLLGSDCARCELQRPQLMTRSQCSPDSSTPTERSRPVCWVTLPPTTRSTPLLKYSTSAPWPGAPSCTVLLRLLLVVAATRACAWLMAGPFAGATMTAARWVTSPSRGDAGAIMHVLNCWLPLHRTQWQPCMQLATKLADQCASLAPARARGGLPCLLQTIIHPHEATGQRLHDGVRGCLNVLPARVTALPPRHSSRGGSLSRSSSCARPLDAQLGNGGEQSLKGVNYVKSSAGGNLGNCAAVSTGSKHSCFLSNAGALFCAGANDSEAGANGQGLVGVSMPGSMG